MDSVEVISLERLPSLPKEADQRWFQGGFVKRRACVTLFDRVRVCTEEELLPGVYLAGPMGSGKSSVMYYCVVEARKEGWLVVYIPRCGNWTGDSKIYPYQPYCFLFDAVLAGLNNPHLLQGVKDRFLAVLKPPKGERWTHLEHGWKRENMNIFYSVFWKVSRLLQEEIEAPVLLAFDDVHELFDKDYSPQKEIYCDAPFDLVRWQERFKRGCVLVTASADSGYLYKCVGGHERHVRHLQNLSDIELQAWFGLAQFQRVCTFQSDEFFLAKIRHYTGAIPQELILLNDWAEEKFNSLLFTKLHVSLSSLRFMDTGLAYRNDRKFLVPLNYVASNMFIRLIKYGSPSTLELELHRELRKFVHCEITSEHGIAFERLFALNILNHDGLLRLRFSSLLGEEYSKILRVSYYLNLESSDSYPSWKDYVPETLVRHSKEGTRRADYIYFGHSDIFFFELTVSQDISGEKICRKDSLMEQNVLELIGKWTGKEVSISDDRTFLTGMESEHISLHYVVVSSRTADELKVDGISRENAAWISFMDSNQLVQSRIFSQEQMTIIGQGML